MQLRVRRYARLDEERGVRGIHTRSKPVDDHIPYVLLDARRLVVMRRQRMPVGDEEETLVFVL